MENLNIVGIKEIEKITKEEEEEKQSSELNMIIEKKKKEDLKNIEEIAFERKAPVETAPKAPKAPVPGAPPTASRKPKKKRKTRGASQKSPEEMKEHMRLMREKAKISKQRRKEERLKKREELESIKLAKKLGISMESLLEYEQKRQMIKEGVAAPSPGGVGKRVSFSKDGVAAHPAPVDYEKIADMVFNRFKTHLGDQKTKRKEAADLAQSKAFQDEKIRAKKQEQLYKQNARYYKKLGKPNMNRCKDDDDAWVSLFRKKR
jgi:hypothetical protein|tara:strand:- start:122 stop:907 length:786 start_codon:yes stop_codon:yes gene_type:complete